MSDRFASRRSSSEDEPFSEPKIDLRELLESTSEGKDLLLHYKTKPFENSHRLRLVRIICTRILKRRPERKIPSDTYRKWADEIIHVFPQENKSLYVHQRVHNNGHQTMSRQGGKLRDCIHNLKRRYRKNGLMI